MTALSVWSGDGGVLGAVAPLGLAAAAGTALVVDLDPRGPVYPGAESLASLVARGPRRAELGPARRGVCVLRNGGTTAADAGEVLAALVAGWPAVVLRLPVAVEPPPGAVAVVPHVPGGWFRPPRCRLVVQSSGWRLPAPPGAVVLPRPRRGTLDRLLRGAAPLPGDRWVMAWRPLWEAAWT